MCKTRTQGEIIGEIVVDSVHLLSDRPADTIPQAMRAGWVNFGSPFAVVTEVASDLRCKFVVRDPGLCDICVSCVPRIPFPLNRGIMHAIRSCQMYSPRNTEPKPSVFLVHVRNGNYLDSTSLEGDGTIALSLKRY